MPVYTFTEKDRISQKHEFQFVYKNGHKIFTRCFVFFVVLRGDETKKIGITVTSYIGNAVERNRIKRQVREFFRLNRDKLPNCLLVVKSKHAATKVDNKTLRADLLYGFTKVSKFVDKNCE